MTAAFPIVDAHQHYRDPGVNCHPWLRDEPPVPFRYGDYRALRRPYLPAHYLSNAGLHRIITTVYVETEWEPRDPIGEMNYVEGLRRETGLQAASPFVRSIRHEPRTNLLPVDGAPGDMVDPRWGAGFALLRRNGLRFDLQRPWWHLHEATALARRFPQTTIILNHTGLPSDRSREGIAGWMVRDLTPGERAPALPRPRNAHYGME